MNIWRTNGECFIFFIFLDTRDHLDQVKLEYLQDDILNDCGFLSRCREVEQFGI